MEAAKNWNLRRSLTTKDLNSPIEISPLLTSEPDLEFYQVSIQGKHLIASSNTNSNPILSVLDRKLGPEEELPPVLEAILKEEQDRIFLLEMTKKSDLENQQKWSTLTEQTNEDIVETLDTPLLLDQVEVGPLIPVTWSQVGQNRRNTPASWNSMCPELPDASDGHAVAGCVAVAVGQIMRAWNWPPTGEGSQTYYLEQTGTISEDFSEVNFNWESIADLGPHEYHPEIAKILYLAGVGNRMNYGAKASGATSSTFGLENFFKYHRAGRKRQRKYFTDLQWEELIRNEILQGRPVIYNLAQGEPNPRPSHAFNIDGYRNTQGYSEFHINWGWGGSANGWFGLNPVILGNYEWDRGGSASIGIMPNYLTVPSTPPVVFDVFVDVKKGKVGIANLHADDIEDDNFIFYVIGEQGEVEEIRPILDYYEHAKWPFITRRKPIGIYTFSYYACDQELCGEPATITIDVNNRNRTPVIEHTSGYRRAYETTIISLSAEDEENDPVHFELLEDYELTEINDNLFILRSEELPRNTSRYYYRACDMNSCSEYKKIHVYNTTNPDKPLQPTPTPIPSYTATPMATPTPVDLPIDPIDQFSFEQTTPTFRVSKSGTLTSVQCSAEGAERYRLVIKKGKKKVLQKVINDSGVLVIKNTRIRRKWIVCKGMKFFGGKLAKTKRSLVRLKQVL